MVVVSNLWPGRNNWLFIVFLFWCKNDTLFWFSNQIIIWSNTEVRQYDSAKDRIFNWEYLYPDNFNKQSCKMRWRFLNSMKWEIN